MPRLVISAGGRVCYLIRYLKNLYPRLAYLKIPILEAMQLGEARFLVAACVQLTESSATGVS